MATLFFHRWPIYHKDNLPNSDHFFNKVQNFVKYFKALKQFPIVLDIILA